MKDEITGALASVEERLDALRRKIVSRVGRDEPIRVMPYYGYGSRDWLWLKGRVLQDEGLEGVQDEDASLRERLSDMLKRYESDEIPGAEVELRFAGLRQTLETDQEGYFEVELTRFEKGAVSHPWTELELELRSPLVEGQEARPVTARVLTPPPDASLGVISDVDDTIVKTGATDLFKHARTVLLNNAASREPFPGVAPFYRALHVGADGGQANPLFYVSSSPWNLFDLFAEFLEIHEIPPGPIFLKDFGLAEGKLLKAGHVGYKVERVVRLLECYPEVRFVLVGDSGQKDAWVYRDVCREHCDRIAAVYLRDLDPDDPDPEIEAIEDEVRGQGVPMMRIPHMGAAAEHAHEEGWISEEQLAAVRASVRDEPQAG